MYFATSCFLFNDFHRAIDQVFFPTLLPRLLTPFAPRVSWYILFRVTYHIMSHGYYNPPPPINPPPLILGKRAEILPPGVKGLSKYLNPWNRTLYISYTTLPRNDTLHEILNMHPVRLRRRRGRGRGIHIWSSSYSSSLL